MKKQKHSRACVRRKVRSQRKEEKLSPYQILSLLGPLQ